MIILDIRKENRTKKLIKKRRFRKSLFNAKILRLTLLLFLKCPEIGNFTIINVLLLIDYIKKIMVIYDIY